MLAYKFPYLPLNCLHLCHFFKWLTTENLFVAEEKISKLEKELKNFQDSVAIQLSTGSRMVDPTPIGIRERIKDVQLELKEKQFVSSFSRKTFLKICHLWKHWSPVLQSNDQLREKVGRLQEAVERLEKLLSETKMKHEEAISEKISISKRLNETEAQLSTAEVLNEGLRKDKNRVILASQSQQEKIDSQLHSFLLL